MLLPFSQFATTTTHVKAKPDKYRESPPLKGLLRALGSSSRVADFAEHDAYANLSHEHDALWHHGLLPPNGGYLRIASAQTHDDSDSDGDGDSDRLGIAMFHQLRCLAVLRTEMLRLRDRMRILEGEVHQHSRGGGVLSRQALRGGGTVNPLDREGEYPMHCFDYLRQSLLCLSDATIERPRQYDSGKPLIDGMGGRSCRDWEILYRASVRSDERPVMPGDS
ncbi:hypothetical protein C2857_000151 [Epichloe festucae Fl1]|uniref:Uncharacterized protein n=1 Tax=Epichloe festucae (strain Fl1) TaxID=877507 RepID=A0A7S9KR69_EPIFF|nr:hypothetical protein C2857_000151 [Epichloe festucae Fl1]